MAIRRNIGLGTCPFLNQLISKARERLPLEYQQTPWVPLEHGINPLTTELTLDCYLAAYGTLHSKKMFWALQNFPIHEIEHTNYEIIDWGCGQGIASLCFLRFLETRNRYLLHRLSRISLLEPSAEALQRAKNNVSSILPDVPIFVSESFLPSNDQRFDNEIGNFWAKTPVVVHLLSNVLDIKTIDLSKFAQVASASTEAKHIFVCVGPTGFQNQPRFDSFFYAFDSANLISQGTHENLHSPSINRHFGGEHLIFSIPPVPNQAMRVIHKNVRVFSAGFEADSFPLIDTPALDQLNFEVSTLFDFSVYPEHTLRSPFAVLSNMVSRGMPTRGSQVFETAIQQKFGVTQRIEQGGSFWFEKTGRVSEAVAKTIRQMGVSIARLEKVFFEALLANRLDFKADIWNILVIERDVECASIAFQDIQEMISHLFAMSKESFHVPEIKLSVCSSEHEVLGQQFDAVFDIAMDFSSPEEDSINIQILRNVDQGNYFKIRDSYALGAKIRLHSAARIIYRPITEKSVDGRYLVIEEMQDHLRYFLQLLFRKFDFRDGQLPILSRALQLKNVIGLLPTGGGKSLTFQLAALLQPGTTVVIDPLTTLMQDQVDGLKYQKISCCACIHSGVRADQQKEILNNLVSGGILFLFISPERLCIENFRQALRAMHNAGIYFAYGVIDEVHCVSEWGHTFRTTYLHIGRNLVNLLKPLASESTGDTISLFGLTATASFDVLADVERELAGPKAFTLDPDTVVRYENCNRLELQYLVQQVSTAGCCSLWEARENKREILPRVISNLSDWFEHLQSEDALQRIKNRFIERENLDEDIAEEIKARDIRVTVKPKWLSDLRSKTAAIFFCPHREGVLGVTDKTGNNPKIGIASLIQQCLDLDHSPAFFVGGDDYRQISKFLAGENNLMVSTKAFGMGIDKPNVRFTIHLCHPDSLESFIQEAGRAGRDRHMALSIILYSPDLEGQYSRGYSVDSDIQNFFLNQNFKGIDYEKYMLWSFLAKYDFSEVEDQTFDELFDEFGYPCESERSQVKEVCRFFERLSNAKPNEVFTTEISYAKSGNHYAPSGNFVTFTKALDELNKKEKNPSLKKVNKYDKDKTETSFVEALERVIYRLSCIGVIEDFTKDWGQKTITITTKAKAEGEYYAGLEKFLQRYYSPERAAIEAEKAKSYRGQNELQKCLGYLTEFVYEKISHKRFRAVADMDLFCQLATQDNNGKSWLEVNEDLKDFIYYYFNSKFARHDYQIEYEDGSTESFSLTAETNHGKNADPQILFKFMRVIDDDVVGDASPKDNIKHLLGASRLIRRGLTDTNGVIDLLIAYCLIFLGTDGSQSLDQELINSYTAGYADMYERFGSDSKFYDFIDRFHSELEKKGRINLTDEIASRIQNLNAMSELKIHKAYLSKFASHYLN